MNPDRWRQIDEIFDAALDVPEAEREAFLSARCNGDEKLRDKILSLLRARAEVDGFMESPAMEVAGQTYQTDILSSGLLNRRIGTYKILKLIGAGGMGEVYLASDEKLKRSVALKILPPEYTGEPERLKRFELEARAISCLNHPNIVTIYDVGSVGGINFIATELVEGKSLREFINDGATIPEILNFIIQVCDALSEAHRAGIIHRDIKPENIMVRPDGYIKVLDFGLAKLSAASPHSMTDFAHTERGRIIGTPGYMSPAQLNDEGLDHRTDLWSTGVVLYELLTGKNPFKRTERHDTLEAILSATPPPCSTINPDVPPLLDRVLEKILAKDPAKGYQSAADLRIDLRRVKLQADSLPSWAGQHSVSRTLGNKRSGFGLYAVAAVLIIAFVGLGAGLYTFFGDQEGQGAIDWSTARSVPLTDQAGTEYFPSMSPDGKEFVYAAEENGQFDIFSQRIGSKTRINLTPDTDTNDTQPAYSPTGESIAFRSERTPSGIYLMGLSGDNLKFVSDTGYHPTWSPDGSELVVSSFGRDEPTVRASPGGGLTKINISTGEKQDLAKVEASFPTWSPNGHRIAYWFYTGTFGRRDIATIPAGGGEPVIVAPGFAVSNWNPVWSPDGKFLYFVSNKLGNMNFWRVRIDETSGQVLSDPETVTTPSTYSRHPSFSRDGKRMLYVQTKNQSNIQGVVLDPTGAKTRGEPFWITQGDRLISRAELSPDGRRFVMRQIRSTQDDIVTVSRDGKTWRDITNDEPFDRYVRWSPDGKQFAFVSDRNEGGQVWVSNADGSNLRQITYSRNELSGSGFPVWSPIGDRLAVYFDGVTSLLDPTKSEIEQTPVRLQNEPGFRIVVWDWSADGKKLAGVIAEGDRRHIGYYSLDTNEYKIVVEDTQAAPSWLPDSRRLVYSDGHTIHITDIETLETKELFSNPLVDIRSPFVSRDGKLLYYTAGNAESDIWLLDLTTDK